VNRNTKISRKMLRVRDTGKVKVHRRRVCGCTQKLRGKTPKRYVYERKGESEWRKQSVCRCPGYIQWKDSERTRELRDTTNLKVFLPFFDVTVEGASWSKCIDGNVGAVDVAGVLGLSVDDNDKDDREAGDTGSKLSQERRALILRTVSEEFESEVMGLGTSNLVFDVRTPCSSGRSSCP